MPRDFAGSQVGPNSLGQRSADAGTRRKEGKNSYATPTPVTDGKLVFAVFGGGGIVALDYQGNRLWTYEDVKFYSRHGLGASPVLYQNLLIMPFDPSNPPPDEQIGWKIPWENARIVALDKQTGKEAWVARRGSRGLRIPLRLSPAQPEPRLYSTAGDAIQAFDLRDGRPHLDRLQPRGRRGALSSIDRRFIGYLLRIRKADHSRFAWVVTATLLRRISPGNKPRVCQHNRLSFMSSRICMPSQTPAC